MKNINSGSRGFSLIELIVATLLLTVVLFGVYGVYQQGYRYWIKTEREIELQESLAVAVDHITRNLRQAAGITAEAGSDCLVYQADTDGNGTPDATYRYKLADSRPDELIWQQWQGGGWVGNNPVASHFQSIRFKYYLESDDSFPIDDPDPSNAAAITRVNLQLAGEIEIGGRTYNETVETSVTLRSAGQ